MGGSAYVINEWHEIADAVLFSFYSGLEGGNALADVLSGDVNPSGKLPFTIAKNEADYPPFLHLSDKEREIEYGYYHGYTLLDKKNIEPEYPFGFGLSYTDFEIGSSEITQNNNTITVKAEVKNIGEVYGEEVVQVYISSNNTAIDRPVKLLKGYKRIGVNANSAQTAVIETELEDIKFFNPETKSFELDKSYTVFIGNSSKNIKEAGKIQF